VKFHALNHFFAVSERGRNEGCQPASDFNGWHIRRNAHVNDVLVLANGISKSIIAANKTGPKPHILVNAVEQIHDMRSPVESRPHDNAISGGVSTVNEIGFIFQRNGRGFVVLDPCCWAII